MNERLREETLSICHPFQRSGHRSAGARPGSLEARAGARVNATAAGLGHRGVASWRRRITLPRRSCGPPIGIIPLTGREWWTAVGWPSPIMHVIVVIGRMMIGVGAIPIGLRIAIRSIGPTAPRSADSGIRLALERGTARDVRVIWPALIEKRSSYRPCRTRAISREAHNSLPRKAIHCALHKASTPGRRHAAGSD